MLIFSEIKNKIIQKKMTVEDVATKIGMSKQGLYAAFQNNSLKLSDFLKIAAVLEMDVRDFFGGEPTGININQVHSGIGDNRTTLSECEKEVEHLRALLVEKERTIQILLNK